MEYTENSAYREIYSIKYIYQQRRRRKIKKKKHTHTKKYPNILPQQTRKRRTIQAKCTRKEIIQIRAETNGINRKSIEKNQQNQKINKINKPVSRLTEKKRDHTSY